jgi:hypothetical protein
VLAGITTDLDKNPRLLDGNNDGETWADMGVYEFPGEIAPLGQFAPPYLYWHFNTYAGADTIAADIGQGAIDVSTWGGAVSTGQGAIFDINRVDDTPGGTSLKLTQTEGGNGTFIMLSFSMTGHENLNLSFVTQASNVDSFTSGEWAWSIDGVNFTTMAGVNTSPPAETNMFALRQVDFSGVTALNNAPNVFLRYTLSSPIPPKPGRFITIDNLQLNADVIPVPPCPGDINQSGVVNVLDLLAVINEWGQCSPGNCAADINGDTVVNVLDMLAVINSWGPCQ